MAPSKPCHNCRRQRLRCDRSLPHCNKCVAAGRACLGYGLLLRWTGAVASRGKLAGRTSSAPLDLDARLCRQEPPVTDLTASRTGIPWMLVDPLFQGLEPSQRYYIDYFTNRLCRDLVSHDAPGCNPFRGLVPMAGHHPLLRHVIVAASAAHLSVLHRSAPAAADDPGVSARQLASRATLHDALVAKHRALRLMISALQDRRGLATSRDAMLAAALFLVNVELIESGRHGWRAHLAGAGRILSVSLCAAGDEDPDSSLRDYLFSDCVTYLILATASTGRAGGLDLEPSQIPLVLSRASANSFLCCPPEILEILHAASSATAEEDDARALLRRAQAVDVAAWAAAGVAGVPALRAVVSLESRFHVGSAHRAAACLYILQGIPGAASSALADSLADETCRHLSSVPDHDTNFKATSWPTFVAGAAAVGPERRAWAMDRLARLVSHTPWGFLYTAMETLRILWNLAEAGRGASWVQILKEADWNVLIV